MKADDFFQAANAVQKFHQQYEALEKIVPVLREIGSVEQAVGEALSRAKAALDEERAVRDRIQALASEVTEAKAKAAAIIDDARSEAQGIAASAVEATAKAKESADTAEAAAKARITALQAQEKQTQNECAAARKELEGINAKVAAANATLLSLKERVSGL